MTEPTKLEQEQYPPTRMLMEDFPVLERAGVPQQDLLAWVREAVWQWEMLGQRLVLRSAWRRALAAPDSAASAPPTVPQDRTEGA